MNPFSKWTQADVDRHNGKASSSMPAPVPAAPESAPIRKLEAPVNKVADRVGRPIPISSGFAIMESHDESKLNKTERAYLAVLRARKDVDWIGIQNVTLKIGDDCRLTCDFIFLSAGVLTFVDTKGGFIREDSTIKIKVAARTFRWARFVVAQRVRGVWTEKTINP